MDKKNAPMIPETIIVELKEENQNSVSNATGDYTVTLDEPILIEEGDQVSIKSVFIDSNIPEEGLIEVTPANEGDKFRTCRITTGFYMMNVPSSLETTFKIDTPAATGAERLCISKVYDPILAVDAGNPADFHANAGVGFTPSDTNGAAPNTIVANTQNALNSRMDGKPYVAMKVIKHSPTDPTTHNQAVSEITIAVDSLNVFPPLQSPQDLTFKLLYYPPGAAGTGARQIHSLLKFNFKDSSNTEINKFIALWTRTTFHSDDGVSGIRYVLKLTNDLFGAKSPVPNMIKGSTLQFPFHKNDERIYIHVLSPAVPPFSIGGRILPDALQENSQHLDLQTIAANDGTPFSLIPITRTTTFELEVKKYVPDELARLISQKMSSVTSVGGLKPDASFLSNNGVLATSRGLTLDENQTLTEADLVAPNGATNANRGNDTYRLSNVTTPVVFARTLQTEPLDIDQQPEFIKIGDDIIVDTFRMNDMSDNSLNYIVGAQDFAVEYDDDSQKFSISSMHTPLYDLSDGTGGSSQVRQYRRSKLTNAVAAPHLPIATPGLTPPTIPARPTSERFWVNKYSGCFITDVEPADLFYAKGMNFSQEGNTKLTVDVTSATLCKDRNGQTLAVHGVPFNLVDGVNVTGEFDGVGAIVQRITPHFPGVTPSNPYDNKIKPINSAAVVANTVTDYQGQYQLYDIALHVGQTDTDSLLPPSYLQANEDRQVGIFSIDHIQNNQYQQVDNPYYKVEVKSKLKNNIEGEATRNQFISSIISKYYSSGNYTSAYNEGSIVYQHKGMPEILNQFSVRLLDNNGVLASDISTKNTVFLEIIKSNFT